VIPVSVIIPVYNAERHLERCLDSVARQTLANLQVIVIDDGSTDRSPEIIAAYQQKYPRRILALREENAGTGVARNAGLERAEGEYIGFVDADDYIGCAMYEEMYAAAKAKNADLVECAFCREAAQRCGAKKTIKKIRRYTEDDKIFSTAPSVCNKIIRREIIQACGVRFPVGLNYEDAEFVHKMMPFVASCAFVETPFYHYLQYPQSRFHSYNEKVRDGFAVDRNTLDFYRANGIYEKYKTQLEYVYIRARLGSSFFVIAKIADKILRENIFEENWQELIAHFPRWRRNRHLRLDFSSLGIFLKTMNRATYRFYAWLLPRFYGCVRQGAP